VYFTQGRLIHNYFFLINVSWFCKVEFGLSPLLIWYQSLS